MKVKTYLLIQFLFLILVSCQTKKTFVQKNKTSISSTSIVNGGASGNLLPVELQDKVDNTRNFNTINDTTFVNLKDFSSDFVYNMKYATSDNFLQKKVYDCEACYLRFKTVKALLIANEKFHKKGYRIMLYDCYRPLSIQKKMWEIVSNPIYVADPKKGSIHNRGGAVDISLVDSSGKELDMGTKFDFFGIEASHNYDQLPDEVINNRKLLKKVMTQNGFKIFESEWWHYNLKNAQKEPISNFKWRCN